MGHSPVVESHVVELEVTSSKPKNANSFIFNYSLIHFFFSKFPMLNKRGELLFTAIIPERV